MKNLQKKLDKLVFIKKLLEVNEELYKIHPQDFDLQMKIIEKTKKLIREVLDDEK